jgi:hypothetical protein
MERVMVLALSRQLAFLISRRIEARFLETSLDVLNLFLESRSLLEIFPLVMDLPKLFECGWLVRLRF